MVIVVVQLFEERVGLELVVQLSGAVTMVTAACAVLVMTVGRSWRSLLVVFSPHSRLWTAFVWWTGMIRQGTIRLTPVLVELIVTVD